VGLMLAAGASRRFGSDKRSALLADGNTLLLTSLQGAKQTFSHLMLVLRPEDDAVRLGVPSSVQVVRNPLAAQGMSSSLVAAVKVLRGAVEFAHIDAAAVLLADMPCINPSTLASLKGMATADSIVLPSYQGRHGHPVIFGRAFWPELISLQGDAGARRIVQRHAERVKVLQVEDSGVCIDIDDSEALAELSAKPV